jgi:hypothetical protein
LETPIGKHPEKSAIMIIFNTYGWKSEDKVQIALLFGIMYLQTLSISLIKKLHNVLGTGSVPVLRLKTGLKPPQLGLISLQQKCDHPWPVLYSEDHLSK